MSESRLSGVEIFAAGTWRGKAYTRSDLDDVVSNFARFSAGPRPLLHVPAVIGHSEDQRRLEDTGLEAAAWATRVWREGDRLKADLGDVPPQIAALIRGRRYKTVSAEIYDEPPAGIPGRGKMLRRIAFLGGEIPQVKGLAEVPLPEPMSERFDPRRRGVVRFVRAQRLRSGTWAVFSEVMQVDRQAMLSALQEHGVNTEAITDAVPDDVLAELCRALEGAAAPKMGEDGMPSMPEPKDEEQARAYGEHARKYYESRCGKHGEGVEKQATAGLLDQKTKPVMMSESQITAIVMRALESGASATVSRIEKFREEAEQAEKTKAVDALLEDLGRSGRVSPAEKFAERQELLLLDRSVVHKFSEAGRTVEATLFDRRVSRLKARPSRFSEQVRASQDAAGSEDGEVAEVERHYEAFAESFQRISTTKDELVGAFRTKRKREPGLTAARFLGGKAG